MMGQHYIGKIKVHIDSDIIGDIRLSIESNKKVIELHALSIADLSNQLRAIGYIGNILDRIVDLVLRE